MCSSDLIRRLQRIAELANAGMNLEGIRQVIELESEVMRLRHEVDQLRSELSSALRHRRESNELVPLQQAITLFGRTPSIFRDKR